MVKAKKLTKGQSRRINVNLAKKLDKSNNSVNWQDEELGEPQQGTVVSRFGQHADIEADDRTIYRCNIRRTIKNLVCGDRVVWRLGKSTQNSISGVIEAVHERTSELVRPDVYDGIKAVAANIDQIFIVSAVLPAFNADIIDRYLIAAEQTGIEPILVLNKADLLTEETKAAIESRLAIYQAIGYQVVTVSSKQSHGMDELISLLTDRTSIFVGQSGVGKSTLVNTLMPELGIETHVVSENSGLGQHTTTVARLYHLPFNGKLIDSPGIREFGLWHMSPEQVFAGFVEFQPYAGGCKFRDCKHLNDPGCILRQAAEQQEITTERLQSYHRIVSSIKDNKLTSRFND